MASTSYEEELKIPGCKHRHLLSCCVEIPECPMKQGIIVRVCIGIGELGQESLAGKL